MRIVFAGTPEFARVALFALMSAGHRIELVLTQPDRPSGRGNKLSPGPVKRAALEHGLALYQPERLRDPAAWEPVRRAAPDVMVVAAYGLILPEGLLGVPRHGCLNIHASLLPRWRGAAPIQRAIEAGDTLTGVTIMQMDAGLDTGPMVLCDRLPIGPDDSGGQIHDRMADLGGRAIVRALEALAEGTLSSQSQPSDGVTYAAKIDPRERRLDWSQPARRLHDKIRAFDPAPGCTTLLGSTPDAPLKIWRSRMLPDAPGPAADTSPAPGTIVRADGTTLIVATGDGLLGLEELQRPGGRRLGVGDFQRGHPILQTDIFI